MQRQKGRIRKQRQQTAQAVMSLRLHTVETDSQLQCIVAQFCMLSLLLVLLCSADPLENLIVFENEPMLWLHQDIRDTSPHLLPVYSTCFGSQTINWRVLEDRQCNHIRRCIELPNIIICLFPSPYKLPNWPPAALGPADTCLGAAAE